MHLDTYTLDELKSELDALEHGPLDHFTDEELVDRVLHLHHGYAQQFFSIREGDTLFRAVRVRDRRPRHRSEISYAPPAFVSRRGRLNRPGSSIFYSSIHPYATLIECRAKVGDLFAVSAWRVRQPLVVGVLGHGQKASRSRAANSICLRIPGESDNNWMVREWQARIFVEKVPDDCEERYRLPNAFADLILCGSEANKHDAKYSCGIAYPSIAFDLVPDNIALPPWVVDERLDLVEVMLVTQDNNTHESGQRNLWNLRTYDFARPDTDENLVWGQSSQVFVPQHETGQYEYRPRLELLPPKASHLGVFFNPFIRSVQGNPDRNLNL